MKKETKLAVLQELVANAHDLCYSVYTPDLKLVSSSWARDRLEGMDLLLAGVGEEMLAYSRHGHYPFLLDSFLNITWIADFEWKGDTLYRIHVLGPTLNNRNSYENLRDKLDQRHLSIPLKHAVLKHLDALPIIASNVFYEYAFMLHYCLTGEQITTQNFVFARPESARKTAEEEIYSSFSTDHNGIWQAEQHLLAMLREGNPNYTEAMAASSSLSFGVKHRAKDPLQQAKNNYIVLLTLCSRASIEGGLSPDIAYDLNDYYMQQIEDATTMKQVSKISRDMLEDYVTRVRETRKESGISKSIQSCCDYIQRHINERLSTKDLAERSGYTEYYFSRKFKQEIGCGIREYIMKEKMERAKVLLSSTTMSILEISLELSFSSRSYFSDTFQKICGVSPTDYRNQTLKI